MKCPEVEFLLTENLTQAYLEEVRGHLVECPNCQRLQQELEAIEGLNTSLASMTGAPTGFSRRVVVNLQKRRMRRTAWSIAATLVFFVCGLGGFVLLQPGSSSEDGFGASESQLSRPIVGIPSRMILADPVYTMDPNEQYLEVILGEPLRPSSLRSGVPSEIKIHRTDMGKVNLTHVSH